MSVAHVEIVDDLLLAASRRLDDGGGPGEDGRHVIGWARIIRDGQRFLVGNEPLLGIGFFLLSLRGVNGFPDRCRVDPGDDPGPGDRAPPSGSPRGTAGYPAS